METDSLQITKLAKLKLAGEHFNMLMGEMVAAYPYFAHFTFAKQNEEALAYRRDRSSYTPMLDGILLENDTVTKLELVDRILEKSYAFSQHGGRLIGYHQKTTRSIKNATAETIEGIDPLTGWPDLT